MAEMTKKGLKTTIENLTSNKTHKNKKMGVFDQGAVIMFISAEDDEIGKFLNANEMFF